MLCEEEKTRLVDEFSNHVEQHFPAPVWRSLFLDRTGSAQFGTATRTLLAVELPQGGPLRRDAVMEMLSQVSSRNGGHMDPAAGPYAFTSFATAEAALAAAISMQRLAARGRLRIGLTTGRCRMALAKASDLEFMLLLGEARARAQMLASHAAPGAVQLAPDTYEALGGAIDDSFGSCVVIAEYDDEDRVAEVSLTLPPDAAAELSTFAGLGHS